MSGLPDKPDASGIVRAHDLKHHQPYALGNEDARPLRDRAHHFRFLDLPRELRDMIYEVMFVRNNAIASTGTNSAQSYAVHPVPAHHRMFILPASYRLDAEPDIASYVNVCLTNRQIFQEAVKTLYSKNKFCFSNIEDGNLSTTDCSAFLQGRTPCSLSLIKSLELGLGPGACTTSHCPTSYMLNLHELVFVVEVINTGMTQLQHLSLILSGQPPDIRTAPWNWTYNTRSFNVSEEERKWVAVLVELRKMKSLAISYRDPNFGQLGRGIPVDCIVAFIRFLRSSLLDNGEQLGTHNIRVHTRHAVFRKDQYWKRKAEREVMIECHDDETGRSRLLPVQRKSPLVMGTVHKRLALSGASEADESHRRRIRSELRTQDGSEGPYMAFTQERLYNLWEIGMSDTSDWDGSDDDDTDSLNGIDIGRMDTAYVIDEKYLSRDPMD